MTHTQIRWNDAIAFINWLRVDALTEPGELNIILLRGMSPVADEARTDGARSLQINANDPDAWDDTILLVWRTSEPSGSPGMSCATPR